MEGNNDIRSRLIEAGIREIQESGIQAFSLRRVAQLCGVSCAAPYKHFKDKQALIQSIVDTFHQKWIERQSKAIQPYVGNIGAQLRAVCREYLRFLCENPNYCTLITQKDESTGKWHLNHLFDQSTLTQNLIVQFAREYSIAPPDVYASVCAIRAVLYGAAMMNQHDDMSLNESAIQVLSRMIDNQLLIFESR